MALILVTGASTGLGLATANALAGERHDVVIHARNPSRFPDRSAPERMHGVIYGDLAHPDQVELVIERANTYGRFDAVIHNAGVLDGPDVMAVNIIAPFVMTALLNKPRRLIYLSSSLHRSASTNPGGIEFGAKRDAYADSKLYVTTLAAAVANRWKDTVSHAVDPGWVPTRMGGPDAADDLQAGYQTQVWLATNDSIQPRSGGYWYHRQLQSPHPATRDETFQAELITALEAYTGLNLD
ncbi:SDR family NAD(P)-dependent oxidoreductase [bacterium RCC_150]